MSQTAVRLGIDNTPGPKEIDNLTITARHMEEVRRALGNSPIIVSSGYRSPEINKRIGGSKTSAHMSGWAVDFICPQWGTPRVVFESLKVSGLKWDQLILEFSKWVHISFPPAMRGQVLIASHGPSGVIYTKA